MPTPAGKLVALLTALVLTLGLAGCSDDQLDGEAAAATVQGFFDVLNRETGKPTDFEPFVTGVRTPPRCGGRARS
ncbi:hypothetical protein [Aestuariimicrobium sp. Y1814]|uniref:hypothetical protein n=1 Tax=Aestuariimicrobium sp. Y1814 TaxID=3418742 RepID=UPI003DA6E20B